MKRLKYIFWIVLASSVMSCYKDLSTDATFEIPDIRMETTVADTLNISFGDSIRIHPSVSQEGRSESDFDYLWEMDLNAGYSNDRVELSDGKDLDYLVRNTPSSTPYLISLTVTDRTTGYSVIKKWVVYVSSSLGEGIVVGYTRDGGVTSDLDLIRNKAVTYGYTSDEGHVTRNLFTLGNGEPIEGMVHCISSYSGCDQNLYDTDYLIVGTDSHMLALNQSTYGVIRKDNELLSLSTLTDFKTTMAFNFDGYQFAAVISGKPFGSNSNMELALNPIPGNFSNKAYTKETVAYGKIRQAAISFYDSEQECFYSTQGWTHVQSGPVKFTSIIYPEPIRNAQCKAAGCGKGNINYFVMKFASGDYHLIGIDEESTPSRYTTVPMSNCQDIDKASCFAFNDAGNIFYYAVGNKIYYNVIGTTTVTSRESVWVPEDEDETVTAMETYYQSWYGTHNYWIGDYDFTLDTNRVQLIITTYNEKTGEGKIYLQPLATSTGRLPATSNGVFGGFGRITAIGTSMK